MPATVNKSSLVKALQSASKAVSQSPVIPLLGNMLLRVQNGSSSIIGTNLELGVICEFPSTGDAFDICVPAKTFTDLMNAIYADEVTFTLDEADQSLMVETDSSSTSVKCVSASEFPPIPKVETPNIVMDVVAFKEMVNRVAFATKQNEDQSVLSGVLLLTEKGAKKKKPTGKFVMFATDGFHISFEETPVVSDAENIKAIVRGSILELVSKLLPSEGELRIQFTKNKAMFQCEGIDVVTQLMSGDFPDYKLLMQAIPEPKTTVTVSTLELLRACKQLKVFAADTGQTKMDISGILMHYSIVSQTRGNSNVDIVAICKGEPVVVGINVHFLLELLEVCKTSQVEINISGKTSPMKFTMQGISTFWHVIMPINLQGK